jgi:NAD(P)-dependent dehydrogenase (short-subunit alcohol dehydrogenase family)
MKAKPISTSLAEENSTEEFPPLGPYLAAGKLNNRKALITGGDSGIGRSVAIFFAKEGADVAINYLPEEQKDAEETARLVEKESKQCHLIPMDLRSEENCKKIVELAEQKLGGIDLIVSNAAYQMVQEKLEDLTEEQVERTFRTNVYPAFFLTKHALPHLRKGSSVIITTSIVAYKGSKNLLDYSATKAAQVGIIRSLSAQLAPRGIRVNGVAPGPVWTPLQPISRDEQDMERFATKKTPLGRIAQPSEIAPSFVFLASNEGSQYTGQVLHPNGGYVVNA